MRLVYLSGSWILGVYLSSVLSLPLNLVLGALVLISILALSPHHRSFLLALFCLLLLVGGIFRFRSAIRPPDQNQLQFHNGQGTVELLGVVDSDPEPKEHFTLIRLKTQTLKAKQKWQKVSGTCLLYAPKFPLQSSSLSRLREFPYYRYGDELWIRGKLASPPKLEDFDYQEYLARKGIYSICYPENLKLADEGKGAKALAWIYRLKSRLSQVLKVAIAEPASSLNQAILLGKRSTLPATLKEDFIRSGIAHVLAISGLHISIVAGIGLSLGAWAFGRHRPFYFLLALLLIWLYTLLTGWRPSALRAAIMGTMWISGDWLSRQKSASAVLLLAAALMIGINPLILREVSFQLSFAAMAGLIFLSPIFISWGRRALGGPEKVGTGSRFVIESLSFTLGAILATLPLLAFYFHRISLVSLPASFFALPALPGVILTSALTGGLGLLSQTLAQVFGWLAWLFGTYIIKVAEVFSAIPFASAPIKIGLPFIIGYYSVLALAIWLSKSGRRIREIHPKLMRLRKLPKSASQVPLKYILLPLLILAILTWSAALALPDGRLHLFFLDVGQGEAILVQTPRRHQILIDGGPDPKALLPQLGRRLPFWDHSLDLVVLTHPGEGHLTGLLEVLRRYQVERVLESGIKSDSAAYKEWLKLVREKGTERTIAHRGQQIKLGDGVKIQVLHPPEVLLHGMASDPDNNSVVLRLSYGKASFLLTSDLVREGERVLLGQQLQIRSTVLQVGHYGSSGSTDEEFLAAVSPQAVVISVGRDNPFGHPAPEVVARLREGVGQNLFLTSKNGVVEFITDGQSLWVKKQKL